MKKLFKIGLGLGLLATQVGLALAADIDIKKPSEVTVVNIGTLISGVVGIAIIGAALLAFAYLVWGGIEWITSGGDKAGMEAARNRITAAFVGLFIVGAAWAITKLIETFFGITILGNITLPKAY
jgi:hypothetical protein